MDPLALALAAITVAAGLVVWLYVRSDGDLRAIKAQARSLGIATSLDGLARVSSPADRVAQWDRLLAISRTLVSYRKSRAGPGSGGEYPASLEPGSPLADGMMAYHAALDPGTLEQLAAVLDGIGDGPLVLPITRLASPFQPTALPATCSVLPLVEFFEERLALAARDQVGIEARRLLRCLSLLDIQGHPTFFFKMRYADRAFDANARRITAIRVSDPDLAPIMDALCDGIVPDLRREWECVFLEHLAMVEAPHLGMRVSGNAAEDAVHRSYITSANRFARSELLLMDMDWISRSRQTSDPLVLEQVDRDWKRKIGEYGLLDLPNDFWMQRFAYNHLMEVDEAFCAILHGRLVAAEIRGSPWPTDVLDHAQRPLRTVERDGRIMGAYSMALRVEDAHGQSPNRYFALYGPLDPPAAAMAPASP